METSLRGNITKLRLTKLGRPLFFAGNEEMRKSCKFRGSEIAKKGVCSASFRNITKLIYKRKETKYVIKLIFAKENFTVT
jgi:hypothetical protein